MGCLAARRDHLSSKGIVMPKSVGIMPVLAITLLGCGGGHGSGSGGAVGLEVNGERWVQVSDFEAAGPDDRVFVVQQTDEGRSEIRFGDGRNGAMPPTGSQIVAHYRFGGGKDGNVAGAALTISVVEPGDQTFWVSIRVRSDGIAFQSSDYDPCR